MEENIQKFDICDFKNCTGCKICSTICPKSCITFVENKLGVKYPKINKDKCIECNLCRNYCPSINKIDKNTTKKVYAAWSNDYSLRKNAASGGIATSLYKYVISKGWYVCGCKFDTNLELYFDITNDFNVAKSFQNSKYVESDLRDISSKINKLLSNNHNVLFIGVPCQVAAIKKFVSKNINYGNLLTVDLICHGFAPIKYFKQHIKYLETKYKKNVSEVFFRDRSEKKDYVFSLYDEEGGKFYKRVVNDNDLYHLGFHRAYIYRENCYNCFYSENSRVGDITLGDYSGLGTCNPPFDKKVDFNVSCILINSNKGNMIIDEMNKDELIHLEERPLKEPFLAQGQLNHPCYKSEKQKQFVFNYEKTGDFEQSARLSYGNEATKLFIKKIIKYNEIRSFFISFIKIILPNQIINKIKEKV